ncbi:hypothetical protein LXL04_024695 [Taraxacum kok-saghyz]
MIRVNRTSMAAKGLSGKLSFMGTVWGTCGCGSEMAAGSGSKRIYGKLALGPKLSRIIVTKGISGTLLLLKASIAKSIRLMDRGVVAHSIATCVGGRRSLFEAVYVLGCSEGDSLFECSYFDSHSAGRLVDPAGRDEGGDWRGFCCGCSPPISLLSQSVFF